MNLDPAISYWKDCHYLVCSLLYVSHGSLILFQEVRVRYHGFGAEEDEWVNVKKDVRERSIPVESSECQKVKVGDLVLCFQVRLFFDKHESFFFAHI